MRKEESMTSIMKKELRKGKTKGLYIYEIIHMFLLGIVDGKKGVPKENEEGIWVSSIINKQKNEYEEYCDKKWGYIQIELKDFHEHCDILMKEIPLIGNKLEIAREQEKKYEPAVFERKRGEENLSDNQIIARRKREETKRKTKNHAEVAKLEEELSSKYYELLKEHNHIVETTNGVRMICERVMKHTNQRLDVYWRAVLRVHPDKEHMPMVVTELKESQAEKTYFLHHKGYEEAVSMVLSKYEKEVTEIRLKNVEKDKEVA